jgi:hypothetical protein
MSSSANNLIVLSVTVLAGVFLFLPRLRHAKMWTATVTPLASIIGSGFLVLAPLLDRSFGVAAGPMMLALCGAAYLFGWAIRHNIACHDQVKKLPAAIVTLERLSSAALAFAYMVSVTYYLNLFGSFGVKLTPFNAPVYGRGLATAVFCFIGCFGVIKGLKGLEKLETWAVSLKLAIIAGLLAGLCVYFGQQASQDALKHPPISVTGWPAATLAFGMIITVQGFETSRYLGSAYTAKERIRSMRYAQWLAAAIYVVYVSLTSLLFDHSQIETSDTAVIDMSRVVATVLPVLLVAAALAAQLSAAIADTVGCGGMTEDVSKKRVSEGWAYAGVAVIGIAITWMANVFEIIALASRVFAFYYVLQCAVATVFAWSSGRRVKATCFATLGALGVVIVLFGRSVE